MTTKQSAPIHDFIIVYRKSDAWHRNLLPRSEQNDSQYRYEDERGVYRPDNYKCNKTADERPNLYYPIIQPNTGEEIWPSRDAVWRYSKERHEENVRNDMVFWGKDGTAKTPSFKRYRDMLRGGGGVVPGTWWTYEFAGHNDGAAKETSDEIGSRVFSTPKPTKLIKQLMTISTNPNDNDIILDFFSGSATTAHAVMQLNAEDGGNRQFIMVQLPEVCDEKSEAYKSGYKNICEIGMERIRRAGAKILAEQSGQLEIGEEEKQPLDVGFKVFELDTSNLKTWDATPIPPGDDQLNILFSRMNSMLDNVKPDRSDLDMVYEIMLKMGIPPTYSVTPVDVRGKTVYSVREDCLLLICLAEDITPEMVEEMCEYAPANLIIGENGVKDATAMANAHYICKDRHVELKFI